MSDLTDALQVDLELVLSNDGDRHEIEAFHTLKEAARRVANLNRKAAVEAVEAKIKQFPVWPYAPGSIGWGATLEEVADAAIDAALGITEPVK